MIYRFRKCFAIFILLLVICGCGGSSSGGAAHAPGPSETEIPSPFEVVPGSTQKVCQLTGEYDAHLETYTLNRTLSRYNLWGTDLGSSFEHNGKLWFLFGDSLAVNPHVDGASSGKGNEPDGDSIAFTTDTDPNDCVALEFLSHLHGTFRSPVVPGVDLGAMNVPLDGISAGQTMYVWFSTGEMTRSVLARSDDNAESFSLVHRVGDSHFVNISTDILADTTIPGLADAGTADWVLLFGSGEYRRSDVYLAAVPLADIEDRDALRFFAGLDDQGIPAWSSKEEDAVALFETEHPDDPSEGCVGELSVQYSEVAEAWLALYNCDYRWIHLRAADVPWGQWSEAVLVFDPMEDEGWCHFINWPFKKGCSDMSDTGREGEVGSPYGPYVMERYTTGDRSQLKLYFVMSTWNPYNVVVMVTELQRR